MLEKMKKYKKMKLIEALQSHKKVLLILLVTLFAIFLHINLVSAQWDDNLNTELLSYYTFDGNVLDSLGIINGTTNALSNTTAINNLSMHINSIVTEQLINLTDDTRWDFDSNEFAFNLWFYPNIQDESRRILAKYGGDDQGWNVFSRQPQNYELQFYQTGQPVVDTNYILPAGTWSMITLVKNATHTALWVNGTLMGIQTNSPIVDNNHSLTIGGSSEGTTKNRRGNYDELGIWNRSLNDTEISQLYNGGNGTTYQPIAPPSDVVNPDVEVVYPANTTYNINVSELNYTYSDANPDSCWYSIDLGVTNSSSVSAGTNFIEVTSSEGSNTWIVYCNDTFGNQNSSSVTFAKDTINPAISILYPIDANYTVNVLELNYSYFDVSSNNCWYSIDNGVTNSSTTPAGTNFTGIESVEGSNTWHLYCDDSFGNQNSTSVTFYKDTEAPVVSIFYPVHNQHYNVNVTELNYSVSDISLDSCWYSVDNGATNITVTCNNNVTGLLANENQNNWTVYANDSFGFENSATSTFYIDTVLPSITLYNPANFFYTATSSFTINASVEDNYLDAVNVTVYNQAGIVTYTNLIENITDTIFWVGDTVTLSQYNNTIEVCARDSYAESPVIEDDAQFTKRNAEETEFILPDGNVVVREIVIKDADKNKLDAGFLNLVTTEEWVNDGRHYKTTWEFDETNVDFFEILMYDDNGNLELLTDRGKTRVIDRGRNYMWRYDDIEEAGYDVEYTQNGNVIEIKVTLGDYVVEGGRWIVDPIASGLNRNCVNQSVWLDITAPTGETGGSGGTSPSNATYTNISGTNFTVNVSDIEAGLENVTFYVENETSDIINVTTIVIGGGQRSFFGSIFYYLWYEGIYKWYWTVADTVNNLFTTAESFITYDITNPYLTIVYPQQDAIYNYNVSELNYTYTEINCNYTNAFSSGEAIDNSSFITFYDISSETSLIRNIDAYNGKLYIVDSNKDKVFEYLLNGTYTGFNIDLSAQNINNSLGIANDDDYIYILNGMPIISVYNIHRYYRNGTYKDLLIDILAETGDFFPSGIEIGTDDYLYFVGQQTDSVYRFYKNGTNAGFNFSVDFAINNPSGIEMVYNFFYLFPLSSDDMVEFDLNGNYTGRNYSLIEAGESLDGGYYNEKMYVIEGGTRIYVYNFYRIGQTKSCGENYTGLISSEGSNTFYLHMIDKVGNSNTTNVTFFKDTIFPIIDFISPTEANNSYVNQNNIYVVVSVTELNLANITYTLFDTSALVDETAYYTETYAVNYTPLTDGEYYYNVTVCDIANNCNNTETRTITLDTTLPNVTITGLANETVTDVIPTNVTFNYSFNDTNIDSCWYNIDFTSNISLNCSATFDNFTVTSDSFHNFTLYGNDSAGNINSVTQEFYIFYHFYEQETTEPIVVAEGEVVNFNITINMTELQDSEAHLVYNNIEYPSDSYAILDNAYFFEKDLAIPLNTGNNTGKNITWFWKYSIEAPASYYVTNYTTTNQTQTAFSIEIDDCSSFTDLILNLTMFDEETNVVPEGFLNDSLNPVIEAEVRLISIGDPDIYVQFNKTYNNYTGSVCVPDTLLNYSDYRIDVIVGYIADTYAQEFWYLDNGTIRKNNVTLSDYTTTNVILRDLLLADSTTFLFTYYDEFYVKHPEAIVTVLRKYIGAGEFREAERGKEDDNGETHLHLVEEDVIYKFRMTEFGELLFESSEYNAKCLSAVCSITLQETEGLEDLEEEFDNLPEGTYNLTSNKQTRIITLSFNLQETGNMNLSIYEYNNTATTDKLIATNSKTAKTGTVSATVPLSYGNATYYAVVRHNDNFVTSQWVDMTESGFNYFGNLGIFLASLLVLTLGLIAVASGGWTIVFILLGLITASITGLLDMSLYLIVWVVCAGGIIIYKLAVSRSI